MPEKSGNSVFATVPWTKGRRESCLEARGGVQGERPIETPNIDGVGRAILRRLTLHEVVSGYFPGTDDVHLSDVLTEE
jgi:hypothetical protein